MVHAVSSFSRANAVARRAGARFARPKPVAIGCLALFAGRSSIVPGPLVSGAPSTPAGGVVSGGPGRAPRCDALCREAFGKADAGATRFSKATGIVVTVIGTGFLGHAVAAHWPVRHG